MWPKIGTAGSLVGGAIAAIAASVCCVGPLVLVTFGIGGAWVSQLVAFESVRPLFIGLTLAFLGFAYYRLYRAPQVCKPETICAELRTIKRQRAVFWTVTALLVALVALPWAAPLVI